MWRRDTRFTTLVNAYAADLFRYACWLCHDRDDAEDLVQETFTRVWRFLDSLENEAAAKGWLLTTLRREHARRYARLRAEARDVALDGLELADPHRDVDDSVEAFNLRRALARMSADYREPLVLQIIGGYSCKEIGELIGASESAVMARLCRARQRLRTVLEGNDESEPEVSNL